MPEVEIPAWLAALLALGTALGIWKGLASLLRSGGQTQLEEALEKKFFTALDGNGLGTRLKLVEVKMSEHDGRITSLERVDETHNFQVAALSERQGKLEGRQDRTEDMVEDTLRRVESRLGNIEGQLTIIVQRRSTP